jgi:hypothetical protein
MDAQDELSKTAVVLVRLGGGFLAVLVCTLVGGYRFPRRREFWWDGPGPKPLFELGLDSEPEEGAEKVALQARSVPRRLKPHCNDSSYGTGEPVPLIKTGFFSIL